MKHAYVTTDRIPGIENMPNIRYLECAKPKIATIVNNCSSLSFRPILVKKGSFESCCNCLLTDVELFWNFCLVFEFLTILVFFAL